MKKLKLKKQTAGRYRAKFIYTPHIDADWIESKIDGHGGGYSHTGRESMCILHYIGSTWKIVVWYYNIILFCKWLGRKMKR
jgi:hypothetical protein